MVDAGDIFAEIDAAAGMVRFLEDPEQYTSSGALQRLNTTIQASLSLAQRLQEVSTQVICLCLVNCYGMAWPSSPVDLDRGFTGQQSARLYIFRLVQPFDEWCIPFDDWCNPRKKHCALRILVHQLLAGWHLCRCLLILRM